MKSTLNYYYQVAKTNINLIFVTNICYYLSGMIFAVFILIFKIDEVKMKGYCECELYEDWKRILYMLADFIVFTPIILYIYMNTKNINFKDWMVDVMIGYKMLNHYSNCSIFIKVNCFKSNSYESIIDDEIFPTSTEESNRNLEKDYEDTDEYMRNFKQHYLGLNCKSRESSFQ